MKLEIVVKLKKAGWITELAELLSWSSYLNGQAIECQVA